MAKVNFNLYHGGQMFFSSRETSGTTSHRVWHRGEISEIQETKGGLIIRCTWVARMFVAMGDDETDDRWTFDEAEDVEIECRPEAVPSGEIASFWGHIDRERIKIFLYPLGHASNIAR